MDHFLDSYGADVAETAKRLGVMTEGDFKEMERSDLGLLTTIPMLLKLLQTKHSDLNEPMLCSQKRAAPSSPAKTSRPAKQLFTTSTPAAGKQLAPLQSTRPIYDQSLVCRDADYEAGLKRDFKVTDLQHNNTTSLELATKSDSENSGLLMVDGYQKTYTGPTTSKVLATSKYQNVQKSPAESRKVTQPPHSSLVRIFCKQLDLDPFILHPHIPYTKLQDLKEIPDSEDMPARYQHIVLSTYAEHAMHMYNEKFGTRYVDKMVKSHLAESLVNMFPCLGDKFASESGHSYLFRESPQGGILYSVFKNKQFRLPAEERLRKPRTKITEVDVSPMSDEEYQKLVTQLKEAPAYGPQEKEAMETTFRRRRAGLPSKKSVAAVIEEYPIFATNPVEIDLEFRRLHPKALYSEDKFREHVTQFLDGKSTPELIKKIVMGLSRKAKLEDVLLDADPVSVAAKTTKICLSLYSGKVTVCLPGGTCISASDAITGFMLLLKTHYVFHENFPKSVKCVYAVLEGLAGITSSVNAGAKSIRTVREITD